MSEKIMYIIFTTSAVVIGTGAVILYNVLTKCIDIFKKKKIELTEIRIDN